MADFRKMLFVLAGLLLIIGTASAQTGVTCTAFVANQPIVRQEGTTEPAGDILITCNGTLAGAQTGPQTLSLYVSGAAITSRQLYTSSSAPSSIPTEAAVLVNDCVTGCPAGQAPTQGFLQNGALVFSGFTLPSSGTQFQIRVTNVRINANQVAAGTFITGTLLATFPIQNQQNLVLAVAQTSLSVSVNTSPIPGLTQCTSTPSAGTVANTLIVKELVNTAFKSPASQAINSQPGQWYQNGVNDESQTVLPAIFSTGSGTSSVQPGKADTATRIRVNFSNIPAGVSISVPVSISTAVSGISGSSVPLAIATSGGDLGTFSMATGNSITLTAPGSVTYEIINQNASAIDQLNIPVTVNYTYTPPSTPNVGTILASATYAPTTAEVSSLTGQIPRFADTSNLTPLFSIAACQTDLLFTFMTNQAGFDTGFAIANTSADPFGTSAQNGTCTLNWYGTGPAAGTSTTTSSIAAGATYVNLVSTVAAGFQGYMIAVCNFQFGHGYEFITDGYGGPGRGLSHGFVASIIPTPALQANAGAANTRQASDASRTSANGSGEALNQ